MQFFKHMTNMRHDPRVKRLIRKYKANGYAIYVMILESIAEGISTDSPLPVLEENVQDLSYDLGIPESEIEEIVKYCSDKGLLQIIAETGVVYCVKIYKYLNTSQTRSDRLRQLIHAASGKNSSDLLFDDIKTEIESTILLQYNKLPNTLTMSETVCDNNDRKDKDKTIKDREKKEEANFKNYSPYTPPSPAIKDFKRTDSMSNRIDSTIETWNSLDLPFCKYLHSNLPDIGTVTAKLSVFEQEEINKAIQNLKTCWSYIEPKYRPSSFHKFIINSLDSWLDSANPLEKYDIKTEAPEKEDPYMTYVDPLMEEGRKKIDEVLAGKEIDFKALKERYS